MFHSPASLDLGSKVMESPELYYEISLDDTAYNVAVNKNEVQGEKALLNAAIQGDYYEIEQLLKSGVCVDAKQYNKLLFYASKNYFTPLQLATLHNHKKCAQLLIDYGADVNAKDLYDLTSLHLAACIGANKILKILLKARAACSLPIKSSYCMPLKNPAKTGCCKIPYLDGTTPLHVAASTNNVECVKELIRYGADFNAVDELGRTSLYLAAQHGFSECVLIHLKEAVGRDILSLPSLKTSDTPLHFAVKYQMIDCVKELLHLGSDVNHRNFEGLCPLHIALLPISSNKPELLTILKLLVLEGHNTDINQLDWEGFTPLHYVCFAGHRSMWSRRPEMAKFLIAYGANIDIENLYGTKLLAQELKHHPEENFEILKYVVKSLLHLPRLKSLGIKFGLKPKLDDRNQQPDLRTPREHHRNTDGLENPSLRLEPEEYFSEPEHMELTANARNPGTHQRPDNNRLPPIDIERMMPHHRRLLAMDALMDGSNDNDIKDASSLMLKKQLWYEEMASSPRTLMHHCRFLIRKTLGLTKLKYVHKLPLPAKLHSYLLFELEE